MTTKLQLYGKWLIIAGILGFIVSVILSFTIYSGLDQGALPAVSFIIVMMGISFAFPSLIGNSTMRIAVFAVVMVFCIIYLKIGWTIGNFEQFKVDDTWVYILGIAFGSKAFQKFAEKESGEEDETDKTESKDK
jgi:hypothetical protein